MCNLEPPFASPRVLSSSFRLLVDILWEGALPGQTTSSCVLLADTLGEGEPFMGKQLFLSSLGGHPWEGKALDGKAAFLALNNQSSVNSTRTPRNYK